jgi:hypothetical protein
MSKLGEKMKALGAAVSAIEKQLQRSRTPDNTAREILGSSAMSTAMSDDTSERAASSPGRPPVSSPGPGHFRRFIPGVDRLARRSGCGGPDSGTAWIGHELGLGPGCPQGIIDGLARQLRRSELIAGGGVAP